MLVSSKYGRVHHAHLHYLMIFSSFHGMYALIFYHIVPLIFRVFLSTAVISCVLLLCMTSLRSTHHTYSRISYFSYQGVDAMDTHPRIIISIRKGEMITLHAFCVQDDFCVQDEHTLQRN